MRVFFAQVLQRRTLVLLLALVLVCCGFFAYQNLALEAYPDIANMQARVITQVPGKAPEEVERLVTIPLEKELNGIPHAKPPRSVSIFGLSVITVVFDDGIDPYTARQQTLERIAQASVPPGITPQLDPNASPVGEVFRYTVEGKEWSASDRKEVQDWVLNRKFKSVEGIVDSTGFGGPVKTYQVELEPNKLKAFNLTQDQVADAINKSNNSTGGSFIIQNSQDYMVRGIGLLSSVSDIENVVISSTEDGTPVRVMDVAKVKVGEAVRKGQVGKDDEDDIVQGILLMRRGENPSTAVANILEKWDDIQKSLPPGMHLKPLYDRTALVHKTVETISHNVAEGIVLVVSLLLLFLFQVRCAVVCAVVIPFALCTAFILLNLFHVPANLLSLGAIDFGIIVDGTVVLVENISRRLHELKRPYSNYEFTHALIEACAEVANPILFSTLIILMTFLPIFSFEHVEGRLFRPLAIMMNFNLIGAVIATTCIIPILCYIAFFHFPPSERESPIALWIERLYEPLLKGLMNLRFLIIFAACAVFGLAIMLLPLAGSEFIPELEEGNIWLTVNILPTGVTLDRAIADARKLRKILGSYTEVRTVVTEIGSPDDGTDPNGYNNLQILVDLNPQTSWRKQFATKDELVDDMRKNLNAELPGLLFNFSQYIKDNMDEAIAGAKGEFAAKIYGQDIMVLEGLGRQVSHSLAKIEGMTDIAHDHLSGQPQLIVKIDRQRAARYGINANDILDVIETSVGGRVITQLFEGERRFDIVLRFGKSFREDASQVSNILIATTSGARVPLSQVATISESHGAATILRDDNERRMAVHANIHGRDLGSAATEAMQRIRKEVKIPPGFRIEFAGQYERAKQAGATLAITIPTTLMLIFLLLNTVFDSSALAGIAMATVPLAAAFGIFSLLLTGNHLSISSGVGFIALFGVCIQNGVVLTAKMRELSNSGLTPMDAALQGAIIRIRPVIIGSLVALVGLVPAAISTGIGSQSQKPFAIVIVGGILPATLLTLVVLPILYSWFGGKQRHHHSFHRPWSGSRSGNDPAEAEKLVEEFQHE